MKSFPSKNDSKPVIIIGAGGHAKVLADALNQLGKHILGFTTPEQKPGEKIFGQEVLGSDEVLSNYHKEDIDLVNGIGQLPNNKLRQEITSKISSLGFEFVSVIHPKAIISDNVNISKGVQIMAGVIIQAGVTIGSNSIINTGSVIDHDCIIGENCHISPGVTLCGNVYVSSSVFIGAGSSVIENITIEKNSIIASGSVIYENINSNVKYIQSKFEVKN